jgi:hypothetical protein
MNRSNQLVPREQLSTVIAALYEDAERLDWETLSPADRTKTYSRWVEDARVGGVLTRYMTPEQARAWIKDGPMKEFSRAQRGAGRYARFGRPVGTTATDVVRHALGGDAMVSSGTEGVKPFHCLAEIGTRTAYVTWGEARNFRNLLWAALRAAVTDGLESHIVVTEPPDHPTSTDGAQQHKALAARCGLSVHHMRERVAARPVGGSS